MENEVALSSYEINTIYKNNMTRLTYACKKGDIETVHTLLKLGANPNGITEMGMSFHTPFNILFHVSNLETFKKIVRLLLDFKLDIRAVSIIDVPLIYSVLESTFVYEKVKFLLEIGCDPNGNEWFNPSCYILRNNLYKKPAYLKSLRCLYAYGANLYIEDVYGDCIYSLAEKNPDLQWIIQPFDNSIAKDLMYMFKVVKNPSVIKEIITYKDTLNFDYIRSKRQKKNGIQFTNDMTCVGNDVYEFTLDELLIYKDEGCTWGFHRSEIPFLRRTLRNPYTNKELEPSFQKRLFETSVIPEITLENAIEMFTKQHSRIPCDKQKYMRQHLSNIIKTLNPYVEYMKLVPMNPVFLNILLKLMHINSTVQDFSTFNNLIYKLVTAGSLTIPYLAYAIDEFMSDYNLEEEVKRCLGDLFDYIKEDLPNMTFKHVLNLIPDKATHLKEVFLERMNNCEEMWYQIKRNIPLH
jgi:hypothetical protein